MISYCQQDCVVVLAPFTNNLNPVQCYNVKTDFDLQLPGYSSSHTEVSLVYFSTIEPIELSQQTQDSIMPQAGVPMLAL